MPLSEELAQEQGERIAKAQVFSFDIQKLKSELANSDTVTMIIRAHLYLEHVLIQTAIEAFPKPKEVSLRNLNFLAKLNLCIAMGLISDEWRAPILRINQMRNRVAHRLEFTFSDSEKLELFRMMPSFFQDECVRDANLSPGNEGDIKWWQIFRIIILWLDISRQRHAERRIREDIAAKNLRRVLDRTNGNARVDLQRE